MLSIEDILENLAEGVVAIDLDMDVRVFNQSAEKVTETSRSVATGRPLKELFRCDPRVVEIIEKTLKEGRLFAEYEIKLHRKFSGEVPVVITTSQVFDADGVLSGAVALIKDISGIKSIEEGSLRKERLAYIGAFASNLAHEIKNPLTGIRGAAQLLTRRVKDGGLREYTSVIMSEADRLNAILNDLLDFARPAALRRKNVNIHMVLDSVILLLQEGAEDGAPAPRFIKEYDPSLPPVFGDERQLTQVFLNLIKNAQEALGKDGDIQVLTRMITEFHLVDAGSPGGKMAAVEIRDNGCGIRGEDLDNIFTPFFTTKPKGSGLGMAISLKIVKEHGGLLKIDSIPGKGTNVSVYLPIAEKEG